MTKTGKYKYAIASILLVIYLFIATPVELWHHHNCPDAANQPVLQVNDVQNTNSPESPVESPEDDCLVCSHLYSDYGNSKIITFQIIISPIIHTVGFYVLTIPLAPYSNSSNKGPPAMATSYFIYC